MCEAVKLRPKGMMVASLSFGGSITQPQNCIVLSMNAKLSPVITSSSSVASYESSVGVVVGAGNLSNL